MSTVTDADRERAADLADQIESMGPAMTYRTLAAALADERAKARAPFLALAEELDRELADRGVLLDRVIRPGDRIRAALADER